MSFLGLDLGASFLKGAVLDTTGNALWHVIRAPFPGFIEGLPPGHREIEPAVITRAFTGVLDQLLQAEPEPEGLVLCSQMHGFIFVDETGRPFSNYHSWQDQRAEEIDLRTGRSFYEGLLARLDDSDQGALGREVRVGHPASQLFYLAQKRLLPTGARACSLADFLLAEACCQPPVTEPTLASGHGLLDVGRGCWHDDVLEKLGLARSLLPALVPTGTRIGTLDWRGRKIPCHTPVGDQPCALLGIGLRENELSLNLGTGSQASLRAGSFSSGPYQVRPYFSGKFLRTITHIPAGRSLNALLRLLTELHPESESPQVWDRILAKLDQVPETDLRADLSFFPGAFGSEGALTHVREGNLTVGHLFLAALESMAFHYALAAGRLDPQTSWKTVVLSGGLAEKIPRLRRLIQEKIPAPQRLPDFPEDTLRGQLILASSWRDGKPLDLSDESAR